MYEEIQSEAHGPDIKAKAAKLARAGEGVVMKPQSDTSDAGLIEMYEGLGGATVPLVVKIDTPRRTT